MIRFAARLGVLAVLVACKGGTSNPWAMKTWDDASLRAWSEECAGTTRTTKLDGGDLVSFTTREAPEDQRLDQPFCTIVWSKKHRRLDHVKVSVSNPKARTNPDEHKLNYTKQLGLISALVPPDVAAAARSVARGPTQRVVKGPFVIEGGFFRPDAWDLKIEFAAD